MATSNLKVVIMGAGEVGKGLARRLVTEGYQVSIIDTSSALLSEVENHLDVMTVRGNGAGLSTLLAAGIDQSDLFVGVSASDEHNLLACGVAKQFGVPSTIARVRGEEYLFPDRSFYQRAMNIDFLINPDQVAAQELYDVLENPVAQSVAEFAGGRLKLIGLRVTPNAPICNRPLKELPALGYHGALLVVSLVRGREVIVPRGDTRLHSGDQIFVIADKEALHMVNEMGGIGEYHLRKVVILGASRVAYFLSEKIDHNQTRMILIEKNEERCRKFADELQHLTILNGDGTDIAELKESGVSDADCFITTAENDETNILSALLAKEEGARRVIALLRKPQYIPLMMHIKPIDVVINPRIATIHSIMRYIRRGKLLAMATIAGERAEAVEVVVDPDSPLAGKRIRDLKIPENVLIGAIVRNDRVIIPRGDDVVEAHDQVILIGLRETVEKLDDLMTQSAEMHTIRSLFQSFKRTVAMVSDKKKNGTR